MIWLIILYRYLPKKIPSNPIGSVSEEKIKLNLLINARRFKLTLDFLMILLFTKLKRRNRSSIKMIGNDIVLAIKNRKIIVK